MQEKKSGLERLQDSSRTQHGGHAAFSLSCRTGHVILYCITSYGTCSFSHDPPIFSLVKETLLPLALIPSNLRIPRRFYTQYTARHQTRVRHPLSRLDDVVN